MRSSLKQEQLDISRTSSVRKTAYATVRHASMSQYHIG